MKASHVTIAIGLPLLAIIFAVWYSLSLDADLKQIQKDSKVLHEKNARLADELDPLLKR